VYGLNPEYVKLPGVAVELLIIIFEPSLLY